MIYQKLKKNQNFLSFCWLRWVLRKKKTKTTWDIFCCLILDNPSVFSIGEDLYQIEISHIIKKIKKLISENEESDGVPDVWARTNAEVLIIGLETIDVNDPDCGLTWILIIL